MSSRCMSLSFHRSFKLAKGSGDIGKWDGRMFKLGLVFISCLISWRLSPQLSVANLCDLLKACRREQTRHPRTHMKPRHLHTVSHTNFKRNSVTNVALWPGLSNTGIGLRAHSLRTCIALMLICDSRVCRVSLRVCSRSVSFEQQ